MQFCGILLIKKKVQKNGLLYHCVHWVPNYMFIIYDVDYEKSHSMMFYHKNQGEKSKGPYITQRNEVKNTASKMTSTS